MLTLDYIQDPGHGWIAADAALLDSLGIADKISVPTFTPSRSGPTNPPNTCAMITKASRPAVGFSLTSH